MNFGIYNNGYYSKRCQPWQPRVHFLIHYVWNWYYSPVQYDQNLYYLYHLECIKENLPFLINEIFTKTFVKLNSRTYNNGYCSKFCQPWQKVVDLFCYTLNDKDLRVSIMYSVSEKCSCLIKLVYDTFRKIKIFGTCNNGYCSKCCQPWQPRALLWYTICNVDFLWYVL